MKIYQVAHATPTQMMSYIFLADDGTLCCMDGGMAGDGEHMLAMLHKLAGDKPHIRYWFFTHGHCDHCGAYLAIRDREGKEFTVDDLVYTFPAADNADIYEPEHPFDTVRKFEEGNFAHIEPKTGDVYEMGDGAEMRVLQTWVPEETMNFGNNSSTVYRLTAGGVKCMFLGDLGVEAGLRLLDAYGEELKSDMVEMAHHGQNGVSRVVYEAIKPDICLWNAPGWLWHNTRDPLHPGKGPWKTLETRRWMEELGAQTHVVTKDGTWEMSLHDGKVDIARVDIANCEKNIWELL